MTAQELHQKMASTCLEVITIGDKNLHISPIIDPELIQKNWDWVSPLNPYLNPGEIVCMILDKTMGKHHGIIITIRGIFCQNSPLTVMTGKKSYFYPFEQIQATGVKREWSGIFEFYVNSKYVADATGPKNLIEDLPALIQKLKNIYIEEVSGDPTISSQQAANNQLQPVPHFNASPQQQLSIPITDPQQFQPNPQLASGQMHPHYNVNVHFPAASGPVRSEKNQWLALLLCTVFFFAGLGGLHRIYAGKYFTGCLQLLTLGGLAIWQIIDFVVILAGHFSDSAGKKMR